MPVITYESFLHSIESVSYIESDAASPATTGVLRLGNGQAISWRNSSDNLDIPLAVTSSDQLQTDATEFRVTAESGSTANPEVQLFRQGQGTNANAGTIRGISENDAGTEVTWGRIRFFSATITAGAETGKIIFEVPEGSVLVQDYLELNGDEGENQSHKPFTMLDEGEVRLREASPGTNYVGFKAPAALAGNQIWTLPDADGSNGQVLTTNGVGVLSWTSAAGGGVSGPVSSTDNAAVRWNGVGGDTLQDSGVIIDDSDNVTGVNTLTSAAANPATAGELRLGNGESVAWRNAGNTANASAGVNSSDQYQVRHFGTVRFVRGGTTTFHLAREDSTVDGTTYQIIARAQDANGDEQEYSRILSYVRANTVGAISSSIELEPYVAGTRTTFLDLDGADNDIKVGADVNMGGNIITNVDAIEFNATNVVEFDVSGANAFNFVHTTSGQPLWFNTTGAGLITFGNAGSGSNHLRIDASANVIVANTLSALNGVLIPNVSQAASPGTTTDGEVRLWEDSDAGGGATDGRILAQINATTYEFRADVSASLSLVNHGWYNVERLGNDPALHPIEREPSFWHNETRCAICDGVLDAGETVAHMVDHMVPDREGHAVATHLWCAVLQEVQRDPGRVHYLMDALEVA